VASQASCNVGATDLQQNSQRASKAQKKISSFGRPNIIYFIWQSAFVIFMKLHRLLLQMGSQYQRLALKQHNLKQLVKEIEKHNIELEKYGFAQSSFTPRYI
jgi:hypothetical protein